MCLHRQGTNRSITVFWLCPFFKKIKDVFENCDVFDKTCSIFADEVVTSHGPIEADKENIRQEPYSLPQGFMWDTLDLSNADVVSTIFISDGQSIHSLELYQKRIFKTEWGILI